MSPHGNNNGTGAAEGVSSAIVIAWWVTLVWVLDQFLQLVCLLLDATPKFFLHKTSHMHILLYCEAYPHQVCFGFLSANCVIYKSTSIFLGGHEATCQGAISSLSLYLSIHAVTFHPVAARMKHYKNPAERRHHHLPFTSLCFPCSLNPKTSIVNNKLFDYVLGPMTYDVIIFWSSKVLRPICHHIFRST